jgi:ATP-binding cassette subfamily F protein uup
MTGISSTGPSIRSFALRTAVVSANTRATTPHISRYTSEKRAERKVSEPPKNLIKAAKISTADKPRSKKLTFKEMREFEAVEQRIAEIETRLPEIERELAAAASDAGRVHELFTEQQTLNRELETDLSRWTELAERLDV